MSSNTKHFGARLVRAVANGLSLFSVFYVVGQVLVVAANQIANMEVLDPIGIPLLLGGMGLFSAIGVELSKDLEEG